MFEKIPMFHVKNRNENLGFHFFKPFNTRFFHSRYPKFAYKKKENAFFVTSEQFDYNSPRKYTVRKMNMETGTTDTLGEFNELSKSQARSKLKKALREE